MSEVEVAVWHPTMSAEDIQAVVGERARIAYSVGEDRQSGSGKHDRTYCRFDLRNVRALNQPFSAEALAKLQNLAMSEAFKVGGAKVIAYLGLSSDESEIYLEPTHLNSLAASGIGVVFRG